MSKRIFVSLVFLTLVGLAASLSLTRTHYRIAKTGFTEKSFCNLSATFDCDTVLASPYAKAGPWLNAELGLLYYTFVFFALWFARDKRSPEAGAHPTLAFLFLTSAFALGYSAFMAYLSTVKLQTFCLFCLILYAVNLLLFALLWRALGTKNAFRPKTYVPKLAWHLLAFGVLSAFSLPFFRGLSPEAHAKEPKIPREAYLAHYRALVPIQATLPTDRPTLGDPNARVTLLQFSDFQCPFCRRAAFSLIPYLGGHRKDVKIVFLNYPLDQACNPNIQHSFHPNACLAAKAGVCAAQKNKFWEYHDLVFENQKRLSRALLLELARQVGLEQEEFNRCLVSPETEQRVQEDLALGEQFKVQGTPAVFLNGRPFRDWTHPDRLKMAIEAELGR